MVLETKFIERPAFTVIGVTESIHFDPSVPISENVIAMQWKCFNERVTEIQGQVGGRSYGLILHNPLLPPGSPFEYTAAVQIDPTHEVSIPEGMLKLEVPAAKYLVLTHRGHLDGLGQSIGYFWREWLPTHPYEYDGGTRTGKYEFECYDQRYTRADDPMSEIDLYFPIRSKE
jgi:predicted transcriptional regulator YdeE